LFLFPAGSKRQCCSAKKDQAGFLHEAHPVVSSVLSRFNLIQSKNHEGGTAEKIHARLIRVTTMTYFPVTV
jgi:hypothetical protein